MFKPAPLLSFSSSTQKQNISPDVLQRLLEARVLEHMEDCLHSPVFSVTPNTDSHASLMISCQVSIFWSSCCASISVSIGGSEEKFVEASCIQLVFISNINRIFSLFFQACDYLSVVVQRHCCQECTYEILFLIPFSALQVFYLIKKFYIKCYRIVCFKGGVFKLFVM